MPVPSYNAEDSRREIDAILSSGVIAESSRQAKLLEYLFSKLTDGESAGLKEYTIAVDLFQKPVDFDQHSDATVRVEAHRLRKKLEKYYATVGRHHPLRVALPAGQYGLEIRSASTEAVEDPAATTLHGEAQALVRRALRVHRRSLLIALIILAAAGAGTFYLLRGAHGKGGPATMPPVRAAADDALPDPEPDAVRILVGQVGEPYVDAAGRRWQADRFFEGGTVRSLNNLRISGTGRPQLFQHLREGTFTYRIPLPPGKYELRLYAAEPAIPGPDRNPDKRTRYYGVYANNRQLVSSFDITAAVGFGADTRSFANVEPNADGYLALRFQAARGGALVSAIELLPMIQGKVPPIRFTTQSDPYTDGYKHFWSPDDYFSGGRHAVLKGLVGGNVDSGLVSDERVGDFEYLIPEPPGAYQVTLFFAEVWFGAQNAGRSGVGARIFSVLLNDEVVERDLDLLKQAPPNQAIRRTYRNVMPDQNGKIRITFVSRKNLASVRAIEVLPE